MCVCVCACVCVRVCVRACVCACVCVRELQELMIEEEFSFTSEQECDCDYERLCFEEWHDPAEDIIYL